VREILIGLVAAALLVAVGLEAWQLHSLQNELTAVHREVAALRVAIRHLPQGAIPSSRRASPRRSARHTRSSPPQSRRVVVQVDGLNYAFAPSTITTRVGGTVTWVNETTAPHTVTSVQRGLFDRSLDAHRHTVLVLHHAGTFRYYCGYHPYMRGVIVVHR
jgi:plastocyanin